MSNKIEIETVLAGTKVSQRCSDYGYSSRPAMLDSLRFIVDEESYLVPAVDLRAALEKLAAERRAASEESLREAQLEEAWALREKRRAAAAKGAQTRKKRRKKR